MAHQAQPSSLEPGPPPEAVPRPIVPLATYLLIVAQVVVWLIVRRYLLTGDAWTRFALAPETPSEVGFLISPFIHLEPAHLCVNLLVLWLFGTRLERALGSLHFLCLYLGAAWFASLMQWAAGMAFHAAQDFASHNAAVGSSGAIAGVIGAYVVRFPDARISLPYFSRGLPAALIIGFWVLYTVIRALLTTIFGVNEGIGHWAHFAGFIFGVAIAQIAGLHRLARQEHLERSAREATELHDLEAAVMAWSALLAMRPTDLNARSELINARLALADSKGAARLARTAIEALVRANERVPAVKAYSQYLTMVPNLELSPGIRYRIGCWLAELGDNEAAFRALCESVKEEGASSGAASALYRAGKIALEQLRSPAHARAVWERLLQQFPDSDWCDAAKDALRRLPSAG